MAATKSRCPCMHACKRQARHNSQFYLNKHTFQLTRRFWLSFHSDFWGSRHNILVLQIPVFKTQTVPVSCGRDQEHNSLRPRLHLFSILSIPTIIIHCGSVLFSFYSCMHIHCTTLYLSNELLQIAEVSGFQVAMIYTKHSTVNTEVGVDRPFVKRLSTMWATREGEWAGMASSSVFVTKVVVIKTFCLEK